jgi:hypothetical protein
MGDGSGCQRKKGNQLGSVKNGYNRFEKHQNVSTLVPILISVMQN